MTSKNVGPNSTTKRPITSINAQEDTRLTLKDKKGANRSRSGGDIDTVGDTLATAAMAANIATSSGSVLPAADATAPNIPYTQIVNTIVNPGPNDPTGRPQVVTLGVVSNLAATWGTYSGGTFTSGAGNDLKFEFDWDPTVGNNNYVNQVGIHATAGTVNGYSQVGWFVLDKSLTHHTFYLTKDYNVKMMGGLTVVFDTFKVYTIDALGVNFGADSASATFNNSYSSGLNPPQITVTSANNGYTVKVNNTAELAKGTFTAIDIWEYENATDITTVTNANILSTYKRVYLDTINPATIVSPNLNKRWVRARFSSSAGVYTDFSDLGAVTQSATPISPVSVDLTPPNEVTAVTGTWSGNNIVINYTLPSTDPGVRFVAQLVPTGVSTPPTGYFYLYPDGTTNLSQTATIAKADMFSQFGAYYSAFSGTLKSIDASDNRSAGVSFTVSTRANPLSGITPTFVAVGISNGITLSWTQPAAASVTEVYQKYTSWASSSSTVDYYTATVSAVDTTTPSAPKLTLTTIKDEDGVTQTTIATGYVVTSSASGTVASNSWVTNFNSGTSQITLNNALTSTTGLVGSTVTIRALVYQGGSPAIIQDNTYTTSYIRTRYYDDWGNTSNFSAESTGLSLNPITADTNPPATPASISATSGVGPTGTLGFNGYITVSFAAVSDSQVRGYMIRYSSDSGTTYSYANYGIDQANPPTGTLTYKLDGLTIGATYKIAVGSYDQYNNVSTYIALSPDVTISGTPSISSYISTSNGFQIGAGVGGTSNQGIYLNANNYWYLTSGSSASLKVGGSNTVTQNTSGTTASAQALVLLTSIAGVLVGQTVTGSASIPGSTTVTKINGNTITLSANLTGTIASGTTLTFSGVFTGLSWDGNNFSVDGNINARGGSFSGNIALSTPGASIYNGTLTTAGALSGDGFIFNSSGLLIQKGSNSITLDATTGGLTANYGRIANWYISPNTLENTLSGVSSTYVGISSNPSATYAMWAGSQVAGGDANKFAVTPAGKLYATDVVISGGSLDVGSTAVVSTTMTGTSGASSITVASATGITVGMYVVGTNIPNYTTVTSIASAPSITLSNANSGTITAGTAVRFIPTTGAHIVSDGRLFAADATITGAITAKSGSFTGNVQIGASGSVYSGTVTAGTPPTLSGAGFILNSSGLRFNSSTVAGITTIDGTTGQLITQSASIGSWLIDANTFSKTTGQGKITLDSGASSANLAVYATNSDGNYTAGILAAKTATSGAAGDTAFWAGNVTGPSTASSANFIVKHSGDTYVKSLYATGTIVSSGGSTQKITIDGLHDLLQMGTSTQLFARSGTTFLSNTALLDGSYALSQTSLNAAEYLAIGSSTNSFGKTMSGIGLYAPNAYINVTASNGIGISTVNLSSGSTYYANQMLLSSGQLKLNSGMTTISGGLETGTTISSQVLLNSQSITLQTWNSAISPGSAETDTTTAGSKIVLSQGSVTIGGRDNGTTGKLTVGGSLVLTETSTYNFIAVGSVSGMGTRLNSNTSGIGSTGSTIVLQANAGRVNGILDGTQEYAGPSRIVLDSTYGVGIWGLPVQGNTITAVGGATISVMDQSYTHYANTTNLGRLPRQRMLVEDPVSGRTQLGMAVYYQDMTGVATTDPTYTSGVVGDLWVQF